MPVWTFVFEYCPTPSLIMSWTNSLPSWLVREAQPYASSCCVFCPCWVSVASGFCTSERNSKSTLSLPVPSLWAIDLSTLNTKRWKRKRQHLPSVGDKLGAKRLSPHCRLSHFWFQGRVPTICVLPLGMDAILYGCFPLFFSNIQFKDLLVKLLNLSYP